MTAATTSPKTGFVIRTADAIYGAGWTVEAAIADAKEWLDRESHDNIPSDVSRYTTEIDQAEMRGDLILMEATEALVSDVIAYGTPNSFGKLEDGYWMACTDAEEEASLEG